MELLRSDIKVLKYCITIKFLPLDVKYYLGELERNKLGYSKSTWQVGVQKYVFPAQIMPFLIINLGWQ